MANRELPAVHGADHLPWGPDPIAGFVPLEVHGGDGSADYLNVSSLGFTDAFHLTGATEPTVDLVAPASFTPTLTGLTTNPTLGTGGTIAAKYSILGKTVVYGGNIHFGTGPTAGTGGWQIDTPVAHSDLSQAFGFGWIFDLALTHQIIFMCRLYTATPDRVVFTYPATWPNGAPLIFDGATNWTLAANDTLHFKMVYITA